MSWREELHQFYKRKVMGASLPSLMPLSDFNVMSGQPIGYWMRQTTGEIQRFEAAMAKYGKDQSKMVEFMIHEGLDPLLMCDILNWLEETNVKAKLQNS